MTVDSPIPVSSAANAAVRSFGSASVRLHAPQIVFEMVRVQTASPYYGAGVELRWPAATAPRAANQNGEPPRHNTAA
jgi:hypothetical protein